MHTHTHSLSLSLSLSLYLSLSLPGSLSRIIFFRLSLTLCIIAINVGWVAQSPTREGKISASNTDSGFPANLAQAKEKAKEHPRDVRDSPH